MVASLRLFKVRNRDQAVARLRGGSAVSSRFCRSALTNVPMPARIAARGRQRRDAGTPRKWLGWRLIVSTAVLAGALILLAGVGPGLGAGALSRAGARRAPATWPPPIKPVFRHPLPGEGVWKPTGPPVDGGPAVLVTTFRPELDYPQIVAYVAWFDHTRTALAYYPGRYEPPNAAVRGPMMVPDDQR